jgi:hypothetical protein
MKMIGRNDAVETCDRVTGSTLGERVYQDGEFLNV